ncbi:MAG: glycosyltransferase family 1 protein [Gammaproteobacteria bacterium]|nr:glycosyltransferase family 1 protein [Gammaproteobacteria bacterium]
MRIAIITDAWHPQVNGVVTTLSTTARTLEKMGHAVLVLNPSLGRSFPCPTYPEIRLAWRPYPRVARELDAFGPQHIHIATEGPLGLAARWFCRRRQLRFTTSYHTQFPQYVRARVPIPLAASYTFLRWFHGGATRTMIATRQQQQDLEDHGFANIARWTRGVDTNTFQPGDKAFLKSARPIWIYAGRVAVEKTLDDFLGLDLPGTKYVVGDGPARAGLETRFPAAVFTGYKFGAELAAHLAAADVFVFPSRTDTFGLVMLEAMACGLPIAAFPVTGPIDVVRHGVTGILDENLGRAAVAALELDPEVCRQEALTRSWPNATQQFFNNLAPVNGLAMESAATTPSDR